MQGRGDAASGQALELGGGQDDNGVPPMDRDTLGLPCPGETYDMAETGLGVAEGPSGVGPTLSLGS